MLQKCIYRMWDNVSIHWYRLCIHFVLVFIYMLYKLLSINIHRQLCIYVHFVDIAACTHSIFAIKLDDAWMNECVLSIYTSTLIQPRIINALKDRQVNTNVSLLLPKQPNIHLNWAKDNRWSAVVVIMHHQKWQGHHTNDRSPYYTHVLQEKHHQRALLWYTPTMWGIYYDARVVHILHTIRGSPPAIAYAERCTDIQKFNL
jgi:hypothetical protein